MISQEDRSFIMKYVDERYFDVEKLLRYLDMHQMVGNEIFEYVDKNLYMGTRPAHSSKLDTDRGYYPLHKASFIDRIPFYFYVVDYEENEAIGNLDFLLSELGKHYNADDLESFYQDLRYLYYDQKLELKDIFNYTIDQSGQLESGLFSIWIDYLHICDELNNDCKMPRSLITSYNYALEESGREALIYDVTYDIRDGVLQRNGMRVELYGVFPCDENGNPIMKWIGVQVENAKSIWCTCEASKEGILYIRLTPETKIYARGVYDNFDEEELNWYRIYTGPLATEFDYTCLKFYRKQLELTQAEVAEAIGANVRTYQKWENGETTPDGQNLLRLMNWLNITDLNMVTKYN